MVELSRRHLAVKLVLCRAEVQEVLCYFRAFCHKTVLFPAGSTTLYNQFTPLKDRQRSSIEDIFKEKELRKASSHMKVIYPGGYGVGLSPEEASGDSPDVVLHLVYNDSFGTDSQN